MIEEMYFTFLYNYCLRGKTYKVKKFLSQINERDQKFDIFESDSVLLIGAIKSGNPEYRTLN